MTPAMRNALDCMGDDPFIRDVSAAVSNSGEIDAGKAWLLGVSQNFIEPSPELHNPIKAFDFAIYDFEALAAIWPAFQLAADDWHGNRDCLPSLARFMAERLPAMWGKENWHWHHPETRCASLADNIVTLVGFWGQGIRPTGSKDPYALRRAAFTILHQILFPIKKDIDR